MMYLLPSVYGGGRVGGDGGEGLWWWVGRVCGCGGGGEAPLLVDGHQAPPVLQVGAGH